MSIRLSRRTILRGLGAALALPALDAMTGDRGVVRSALAGPTGNPVRLVTFFIPNGVPLYYPQGKAVEHRWFPAEEGAGWTMTQCLEPIAAYRERFNILNGVVLGESCADGHAGGTTGFATGLAPTTTGASGPSVDQVAAQKLGQATPFKSLCVGVQPVDQPFNEFAISTFDELSWAAKDQVEPLRRDPAQLFADLFAGGLPDGSPEAERRKKYRLSVIDFVKGDVDRLKGKLGKSDNVRLEAHLGAIRDLEQKIEGLAAVTCTAPGEPVETASHVEKAKIQAELLAMALRCDLTRCASFMYGHGGNSGGGKDEAYGLVEVGGEWPQQHNFTHWLTEKPDQYDELFASITQFTLVHMGVFRHFLDKLTENPAGPDDLLKDTLVYFGSELGDGTNHDNGGNVLPILLVGEAGGQNACGRHVKLTGDRRVADVLYTMLGWCGADVPEFAGATAPISI